MIEKLDAAGRRLSEIIEKTESGDTAPSESPLLFIENFQNLNPFFCSVNNTKYLKNISCKSSERSSRELFWQLHFKRLDRF